ncbi:MAG: phosphoserine transaminase [Propionibacteriaceae bacterium]|jgi:phosphoserine aminotransferase|nr:phosphoserine transaminase [Propionibacteriaceae bacterium]
MAEIVIPRALLPYDGRFGSGPAKIRHEALTALGAAHNLMGTSHRQQPVKDLVASVQGQLAELYALPTGYQVVLGNGGATLFWDLAACSLIERRAAFGVCGEFSRKFADSVAAAPFLDTPVCYEVEAGRSIVPTATPGCDTYAWAQNETSTGAIAPVIRPAGADTDALVLIDATSAAGGMNADIAATDAYYFAPQKNFGSDGGLWLAFLSPAAWERAERIKAAKKRWMPPLLDLTLATANSAQNQTYNTPAIATLFLLDQQLRWMLAQGGMPFITTRVGESSSHIYAWAEANPLATPFVADPTMRSPVVCTIDFDESVATATLLQVLRANGVVDIAPYRSLGRNQLRIGVYAAVNPDDVRALTTCIDYVLERLTA